MLAHRLHWIYEDGDWFHPQIQHRKNAPRRAAQRRGSLAVAARHRRLDRRDAAVRQSRHRRLFGAQARLSRHPRRRAPRRADSSILQRRPRSDRAPHRRARRSFHAAGIARQPVQGAGGTDRRTNGRSSFPSLRIPAKSSRRSSKNSVSMKLPPSTRKRRRDTRSGSANPAGIDPMNDQTLRAVRQIAEMPEDKRQIDQPSAGVFCVWSMSSRDWARSSG